MRLYWDSHALFLIGISPDACRLLDESAAAGHKLLTSPWAVATARSNLAREPQVDIGAWTLRLQGFQLAEDHTLDPTLALPRQLLALMTAALSAQADRFLTGDAGTRSLFPEGKFRSIKVLTLGEWLSELHTIPAISPSDPARPVAFVVQFEEWLVAGKANDYAELSEIIDQDTDTGIGHRLIVASAHRPPTWRGWRSVAGAPP